MKLDGLDHPKVLDFASRLQVTRPTAIGHLELLWHYCASKTPQGNIGKWPDGAIARACEWMGDPQSFLVSLLESGLVDAHPVHRYVVHDWHEHAPSWVKAKLQKVGIPFVSISVATVEPTSERTSEASNSTPEGTSEPSTRAQILPSQAKPSLTKPSHTERARETGSATKGDDPPPNGKHHPEGKGGFNPNADREGFERIKAAYPKFAGRQDWITAENACVCLLDDGETWESLLSAVERYAKHIRAKGDEGTQYVLRPGVFFTAADRPWLQDWHPPALRNGKGNGHSREPLPSSSADAFEDSLIEREIRAGRTDEEIVELPDLEIAPNLRARIRAKRQELQHAGH